MLIDLSVRIEEGMPIYPGDPKFSISPAATFETHNNLGHHLALGTHTGTHIDAPAHMLEGGKTLDQFPISKFSGPAKYILVENNVFDIEAVKNAKLQPGDIVVFNTSMSYKRSNPEYFSHFPVMSEEIADYLVEKQVSMVALDTCSADSDPSYPIHKILLGADILIIEQLTNLEQLSGMRARIFALPLRLNVDGAPARVVAEVA